VRNGKIVPQVLVACSQSGINMLTLSYSACVIILLSNAKSGYAWYWIAGSVNPLPIAKPCCYVQGVNASKNKLFHSLTFLSHIICTYIVQDLEVYMKCLILFISLVNPGCKCRNIVSTIWFTKDVEVILNEIRMRLEKLLHL